MFKNGPANGVHYTPSGLAASVCKCKNGQKDVASQINAIFNDVLSQVFQLEFTPQALLRELVEIYFLRGGGNSTDFESYLESQIKEGTLEGVACKCPVRFVGFPQPSASAIRVCGHCIGTDKIGHFFEEGLVYYDIASRWGIEYAVGWGYWTEGLLPPRPNGTNWQWDTYWWFMNGQASLPANDIIYTLVEGGESEFQRNSDWWGWYGDIFGTVIVDPRGSASPADLAANYAGYLFWSDLLNTPPGEFDFNICNYVTEDWDHLKNPNIPGAPRRANHPVPI